jgi:hypothetical protein
MTKLDEPAPLTPEAVIIAMLFAGVSGAILGGLAVALLWVIFG